jgi:ubiquinone/menaquinone biosynthesis C-methylase UbiE
MNPEGIKTEGVLPISIAGDHDDPESRTGYWNEVGSKLRYYPSHSIWRNYCDTLNRNWLSKHLPGVQFRAALKTDLFDEAVGKGVYPLLGTVADHVYGIDVADATCCLARDRFPNVRAVACDVRNLPFPDAFFGVVVSLSTLDHFRTRTDIEEALKSLHRVLQPGGFLMITLDNLSNPAVRLRNSIPWKVLRWSRLVPYEVGTTLSPKEFCRILAAAGFEVQYVGTLLHFPRVVAALIARLLRSFGSRTPRLFCWFTLPCEWLARLPTANWTGYYITVKALKPTAMSIQ